MLLYPQLPNAAATRLAAEYRLLPVPELTGRASVRFDGQVYTATGGARVSQAELSSIRSEVVDETNRIARGEDPAAAKAIFDARVGALLHRRLAISPAEANKAGVWNFLSLVLLPDVVRLRFKGGAEGTPAARFLSGRRNALERVWRRALLLHDPERDNPYELLSLLGEDELVQIVERPFLSASRRLARACARGLVEASASHPNVTRRVLIRESQKRLMRLAAFVSFESLEDAALRSMMSGLYDRVAATATINA